MSDAIHATTIAIDGRGVMLRGPSGAGKSDLALRLIDRGAQLVADDRTRLHVEAGYLIASCPETIAGMLEVRGVGIVHLPYRLAVPVLLLITLSAKVERMTDPATHVLDGIAVPMIVLDPFEASAPIKVEQALRRLGPRA